MEYEKLDYPTALENEMVQGIRSGKKDKLAEVGKTFSEQVILSRATPECIRNYTLRFLMGIARVEGEIREMPTRKKNCGICWKVFGAAIHRKSYSISSRKW